jgi:MraZ protein
MGRVTIPQHLKDYASLQDEVVLAGFVSHIEIWNLKRWEEFSQIMNDEEKVNQNLMELGF